MPHTGVERLRDNAPNLAHAGEHHPLPLAWLNFLLVSLTYLIQPTNIVLASTKLRHPRLISVPQLQCIDFGNLGPVEVVAARWTITLLWLSGLKLE